MWLKPNLFELKPHGIKNGEAGIISWLSASGIFAKKNRHPISGAAVFINLLNDISE
jgi:hypothetical protein